MHAMHSLWFTTLHMHDIAAVQKQHNSVGGLNFLLNFTSRLIHSVIHVFVPLLFHIGEQNE